MNRDDIIRIAREAGIDAEKDTLCRYEGWVEPLERFFHLAYAAGAAAEREACAKVCEQQDTESADRIRHNYRVGVLDCAAAIRARGQE